MGEDVDLAVVLTGDVCAGTERGADSALQARNGAFDLPPLGVLAPGEVQLHRTSVGRLGHRVGVAARVDGDDGLGYAELFAAVAVMGLGIVGAVGQQSADADAGGRLVDGRQEVGRVVLRSEPDHQGGDQVRGVLGHDRQLRPGPMTLQTACAVQEMAADVMALQPRGVDRSGQGRSDQAAAACASEQGIQEAVEPPFSSRRCWAFCKVVK